MAKPKGRRRKIVKLVTQAEREERFRKAYNSLQRQLDKCMELVIPCRRMAGCPEYDAMVRHLDAWRPGWRELRLVGAH